MKLLVTGGGTGGHIYPALAVAKKMKEVLPKAVVLYVGTRNGMESSIVPKENVEFCSIRSSGIMGKRFSVALKGIFNASIGLLDAIKILKSFQPDVVLGTGGYVSGPVVLSAWLLRIPCAIQEQNAVPGKTNLLLSRFAKKTFVAWEYSVKFFPLKAQVIVSGNPVKEDLFHVTRKEGMNFFCLADTGKFTLLVLGGSRGAKTIVDAGIEIAKELPQNSQMLFITGREYYKKVVETLKARAESGIEGARTGNIIIRPYVYRMEMAYQACDLVLARAGGMTLSEITALGLPSIIVPSPNVVANHQEYNARALEEAEAAVVIREDELTVRRIVETFKALRENEKRLQQMRDRVRLIGRPSASEEIVKGLIELSRGR